ncbi:hypothetical protein EW026_g1341 [Hermanssonia centrifuga]|uniref:Uncharacterized protein n=2 Tax=Hermanssonia centrifuga TaxID=98765 RepID=A0A4S4KRQ3_9APHY|nr:hypothetical protein EW026_g1341 [Hermanssonia centrifuga]
MVYPFVIACSILPFQDKRSLNRVSCLQMTRTKMFFTWNPRFQFDEPLPQAIEGGAHHDEEHEQFDSPTADDSDDEVTQSLLDDEIDEAAAADDDEFAAYDEMLAEEHASRTFLQSSGVAAPAYMYCP